MPELPEVETVRSGLQRLLPGRIIGAVTYNWPKGFPNAKSDVDAFLIGSSVVKVRRRAKVLIIELSSGYSLVIHLKMTGQLVFDPVDQTQEAMGNSRRGMGGSKSPATIYHPPSSNPDEVRFGAGHPNDSLVGKLPDKSTRVIIAFVDGCNLYFNDQRKFGWVKLVESSEVESLNLINTAGPEPLEAPFTWQVLRDQLQRRKNTSIKAAILDQTVVAGIGNIYADEALWGAKIHPATLVRNVTVPKIKLLHRAIVDVLQLSIKSGGSSNRNYVNAEGKKGSYMEFANVFRCEGQPCPRCGVTIIKLKVAGRGTHICPNEQEIVT